MNYHNNAHQQPLITEELLDYLTQTFHKEITVGMTERETVWQASRNSMIASLRRTHERQVTGNAQ